MYGFGHYAWKRRGFGAPGAWDFFSTPGDELEALKFHKERLELRKKEIEAELKRVEKRIQELEVK